MTETETELDVPRLRKALEWVKEESDRPPLKRTWCQNTWAAGTTVAAGEVRVRYMGQSGPWTEVCGTQMCVAGWVCYTEGDRMVTPGAESEVFETACNYVLTSEGQVKDIPTRARDLLGLRVDEANALFWGGNSYELLLNQAREICLRYGEELGL